MRACDSYRNKIYLNDRPYNVIDVGEGECKIYLVAGVQNNYVREMTRLYHGRIIFIDISMAWGYGLRELSEESLSLLTQDIHLLFDVFWLDHVSVDCPIKDFDMRGLFDVIKSREYSKELRAYA
ncbi:hypothetical protein VIAG107301_00235 [Vibrio agarivorans]